MLEALNRIGVLGEAIRRRGLASADFNPESYNKPVVFDTESLKV